MEAAPRISVFQQHFKRTEPQPFDNWSGHPWVCSCGQPRLIARLRDAHISLFFEWRFVVCEYLLQTIIFNEHRSPSCLVNLTPQEKAIVHAFVFKIGEPTFYAARKENFKSGCWNRIIRLLRPNPYIPLSAKGLDNLCIHMLKATVRLGRPEPEIKSHLLLHHHRLYRWCLEQLLILLRIPRTLS